MFVEIRNAHGSERSAFLRNCPRQVDDAQPRRRTHEGDSSRYLFHQTTQLTQPRLESIQAPPNHSGTRLMGQEISAE